MKEFTSQTGGRHTYIDDVMNLQDLALAFSAIFDACDNFIISGCQRSGGSITSGFVYINKKIRYFSGKSGLSSSATLHIYEKNSTENVSYADAAGKVGRNVYGCDAAATVPASNDPLTNARPQSISITSANSALRLKDAFFGKYALMIDSPYSSQTVKKNVEFEGVVDVDGIFNANNTVNIKSGTAVSTISYSANGTLTIQSKLSGMSAYKFVITNDGKFEFYIGSTKLCALDSSGMVLNVEISTTSAIKTGATTINNNAIYNHSSASNSGVLNINMVGYNGGTSYYRNTNIGDGKGNAILAITGSTGASQFNGTLTVKNSANVSLTLQHGTLVKTDNSLIHTIGWKDKNAAEMAYIGYTSSGNFNWYIKNHIGNVCIENNTYITGTLYVGGTDVMATLATKNEVTTGLNTKANSNDVYTKTQGDNRYVKKTDSISLFVTAAGGGLGGQTACRTALGAASQEDMNNTVKLDRSLVDLVQYGLDPSSPAYAAALKVRKELLCHNIGAATVDDIPKADKDSGWVQVTVQNCGLYEKLYVRQVGKVVSIQGRLHTHHSGTVFTLPNTIDPPSHEIGYSHCKVGKWHCVMAANSRDCVVDYCDNGCSEYVGFLLTYII